MLNKEYNIKSLELLSLLQLCSPALPVGAYSYSEGLETLVNQSVINGDMSLKNWLNDCLFYGAIRIEAAIMLRAYQAYQSQDFDRLSDWNNWLTATRETSELRQQSWQMGGALITLIKAIELHSEPANSEPANFLKAIDILGENYHFAIAFGMTANHWQIDLENTLTGYLYSWVNNIVSAGVRLIPLGQTAGQKLLLEMYPQIRAATQEILTLADDDLSSCSWGLSLASMQHETLYTRLFRS